MATEAQAPDVGSRVREAREAMGLSQTALAEKLGQGERTIQAWERNERTPRLATMTRFAALAGVTVAWFYGAEAESNGKAAA